MNASQLPQVPITTAARLLGVSWKTANRWVRSGQLKAVKIGGRYRTTEQWIQSMVQSIEPCKAPKQQEDHINDAEQAYRRIAARWGVKKMPRPKL